MNLLAVTVLLPLVGAVVVAACSRLGRAVVRQVALGFSLVTLALAGMLVWQFPQAVPAGVDYAWLAGLTSGVDVRFSLGLDGLGVWMFGLSALLTVTAILVSWESITEGAAGFYALVLLLESGLLGVFVARDIILFYVFFEFTLIPLFFLIGIWGSENRRWAAQKFFLFTLAGSLLTFLGLLAIVLWDYLHGTSGVLTFSIPRLTASLAQHPISMPWQWLIFLALFAGFAIKVPLFPLHTWLPLAHVQAPTAGSVILAGILLKIGTYGFLRFSLPMLPDASVACMPWILWLSVAGILYGALVALAQTDIKRLIAYSSVSHLGFCMLGIFALNRPGLQGGMLQMVNHGLSTGGLFAIVGMIYERYHTREISWLGGLAKRTPWLAMFMLVFTFSSIGLPGLNGFVGEFFVLLGMFQRGWGQTAGPDAWQFKVMSVLAVSGVVLGAWYMLWLVERVFFGPLREGRPAEGHDHHAPVKDISLREVAALAPLLVLMVWIGVTPQPFLQVLAPQAELVQAATARSMANRDEAITARPVTVSRTSVLPAVGQGGAVTRVD